MSAAEAGWYRDAERGAFKAGHAAGERAGAAAERNRWENSIGGQLLMEVERQTAVAEERARIVTWLRKSNYGGSSWWEAGYAIADAIERGDDRADLLIAEADRR